MGAIEDVRKVIQDLVAPELKSLQSQIKGVDDTSKLRDEALSAKIDHASGTLLAAISAVNENSKMRDDALFLKIDNLSDKIDRKFEIVFAKMEANHASLIYSMNIEKRVEAIERKAVEPMQAT